jgi:hypothetical protein
MVFVVAFQVIGSGPLREGIVLARGHREDREPNNHGWQKRQERSSPEPLREVVLYSWIPGF